MKTNEQIVNKAIDYILCNLENKISVEDIANHCNLSKYYFNRLFKGVVGESIYSFVKRVRIERAAFVLKSNPNIKIIDIGTKYNISSSNFSTGFKKYYKCSPQEFKKEVITGKLNRESIYYNCNSDIRDFNFYDESIDILTLKEMRIVYKRYFGSYIHAHENKMMFRELMGKHVEKQSLYFEIYYDDPILSRDDKFIYDCCVCSAEDIQGCDCKIIPERRYAKYNFEGDEDSIFSTYQGILNLWLPQKDLKVDENYVISVTKNSNENNKISMEIYIPIK